MRPIRKWLAPFAFVTSAMIGISATAGAAEKPNILVFFGDDIGQTKISVYSPGVVLTKVGLPGAAAGLQKRE